MSPVQPETTESRRLAGGAELAGRRGSDQAWSRFAQAQSHDDFS